MRITSHLWVGLDHALVILDRKLKFCYELLRKNIGADLIIEIKCIWKTIPAYESNKSFVNGMDYVILNSKLLKFLYVL